MRMAPEWVSFPKCRADPPPRLASCFFLRTSNAVQVACGECDSAHIKGGPELSVQEMKRSWENQAFCGPRAWGPISPVPGVPDPSPASQGAPLLGFYWPIPWNCRQLGALRGDFGTGVCTSFKRTHFRILLISWARSHGNGPGTSALGSKLWGGRGWLDHRRVRMVETVNIPQVKADLEGWAGSICSVYKIIQFLMERRGRKSILYYCLRKNLQ